MKEDFVTYEIAVKLKEKGFPQHICDDAYITENEYDDDKYLVGERWGIPFIPDYCIEVAAPTISQVLKWLREEKKIHIDIDIWGRTWGYDIIKLTSGNSLHWTAYNENINNYEQAAIAGIEYVIDNLI